MILTLINCLETSNSLLNTFHNETEPGIKQDLIQRCIDNNSEAIIAWLEYGKAIEVIEGSIEETEYIGQYFAIPVEVADEIKFLLKTCEELKPDEYYSDRVDATYNALEKIAELLKTKDDE
jgi:hypothetical protein